MATDGCVLKDVSGVQREPWESRFHWLCRRKFIEDHKNMYTAKRTVCLSMVWANMNFLESSYSKDIEHSVTYYPVPEKNELERWLSAHSDIQEEEAERRLGKEREQDESAKFTGKRTLGDTIGDPLETKKPKVETSLSECDGETDTNESSISHQLGAIISSFRQKQDGDGSSSTSWAGENYPVAAELASQLPDSVPIELKSDPKWKKTLKLLSCWCLCPKCYAGDASHPVSSLHVICDKSKIKIEFMDERTSEGTRVTIVVEGIQMSSYTASNKKKAKTFAAGALMSEIRQRQTEIQFECPATGRRIVDPLDITKTSVKEERISDDNKGHQMLLKMGWKEEDGLGTHGQGQRDPVVSSFRDQRGKEGLGATASGTHSVLPRRNIHTMLQEFMASNEMQMEFSSDLTNDDRKTVHTLAEQYNLYHKSMGSGSDRFLVVSKKTNYTSDNTGFQSETMRHGNVPGPAEYGGTGTGPMRHRNVSRQTDKPYSRF